MVIKDLFLLQAITFKKINGRRICQSFNFPVKSRAAEAHFQGYFLCEYQ
jgi:hypothetical protein